LVIESALGPVTTSLASGASGSVLFSVAQQRDRLPGRRERGVPTGLHRRVRRRRVDVGVVEQAELELQPQDPPYRLVDPLLGHQSLPHVLDQPVCQPV
jgi:hypothetical protein